MAARNSLKIEPHFVRKGCPGHFEIAILPQFLCEMVAPDKLKSQFYCSFWRSNLISCEMVAPGKLKPQFLLQFLAIEPHLVGKGCVSCRLVGTAPAPAFRREIEKKEKARGQESKRARGQEGKRARGQEDKRARGQEGNRRRCEDEKMWGWEDVLQTPTIGAIWRTLRSDALGK